MRHQDKDTMFNSTHPEASRHRESGSGGRDHVTNRGMDKRFHEYLKDLRWGVPHTNYGGEAGTRGSTSDKKASHNRKEDKSRDSRHYDSSINEEQRKRMMRLHATVPDSTFAERSAARISKNRLRRHADDTYGKMLYTTSVEMFRNDNFFQEAESSSDNAFSIRHDSQTSTDEGSPVVVENEIHYSTEPEAARSKSHRERSPYRWHPESDADPNSAEVKPPVRSAREMPNHNDNDYIFDVEFGYEEPGHASAGYAGAHSMLERDYSGLVMSLRAMADQIESMASAREAAQRENERIRRALYSQLHLKNQELARLRNQAREHESERSDLEARLDALEAKLLRLKSTRRADRPKDQEGADGEETDDSNYTATMPAVIIDADELDQRRRSYITTLKTYLYTSMDQSSNAAFQSELYRDLSSMPEVVRCGDLVDFINDGIRSDADVLHSRLRHSALRHGINRIFTEGHLPAATNRYPYPQEFERRVVDEMESSHPPRRFSMHGTAKSDAQREKMGVVMNRLVLLSILKHTDMGTLYNYLFTALYYDNFRAVEILKESVARRFLDFQLAPTYSARVSHPMMWSFGDSCNATQAYRYMKALDFNFATFPTDPHNGDNLWHRVAKGDAVAVVQTLKPYAIDAEHISAPNHHKETPLDVAKGKVRVELMGLAVVQKAAKGSENYRDNDFEAALKMYSEAIEMQIEVLSIDGGDKVATQDVNLGKLYYNKARSLMHLDRWTGAVEACELCVQHIPSYTNAYATCIQAYEKLLDWGNAAKTCYLMRENCGVFDDEKMAALQSQLGATMFQILGVSSTANPREIKQAFNQLCKQWHPDKINLDPANVDLKRRAMNQFNRLYEAREKLLDDSARKVEQSKPETPYKHPEPIVDASGKASKGAEATAAKIEPLQHHLSKLKCESQDDVAVDEQLLQTAVDRIQQQMNEMHAKA
ncbi:DnaJ domain containing protein, putative [Babesia bigemina]|uniref:DnaJ domain containing protein, putative n=1 Tax=Babesia bigemina TaxID=5866 RepID=A0A061D8I5_BABBI|nr:DnaJ domain containing protein, putative [Babesia bigemina]CDR97021.1 DnaJ domain containing protein, putative [Babesia bigemina]|eukprot:XP_012769207.1 DnaJ domain containing protein, putative [Babesia bigemina]